MFFFRKHNIELNKPLNVIKNDLKSKNENLKVIEIDNNKLRGILKFAFNRYSIVSDITLSHKTDKKIELEFKNTFDFETDLIFIFFLLMCWGISINHFINLDKVISFDVIFPFVFPFIGFAFVKYHFNIYDRKLMSIYKSLLINKSPN